MLIPGGVMDQPAALWTARGYAGSIWQLLTKLDGDGFDPWKDGALDADEKKLHKKIMKVEVDRSKPVDWYKDDD